MNLLEIAKRKAQQTKLDNSAEQQELWKNTLLQQLQDILARVWERVKIFNLHSTNDYFKGQVQTDFDLTPRLDHHLVGSIKIDNQNIIYFQSKIDFFDRQVSFIIYSNKGKTVYDPFLEYDILKRDFEKTAHTLDELDQALIEMAEYLSIYCK